jgi:hypothetical protein
MISFLKTDRYLFFPAPKPYPNFGYTQLCYNTSEDRLFFISIPFGTNDVREWRLVQLDYKLSVACSPSCIETGRFLCSFYISHSADWRFNAVNQRFWLQHFKEADLFHPDQPHDLHLVKPSTTSKAYAIKNNLAVASRQEVRSFAS